MAKQTPSLSNLFFCGMLCVCVANITGAALVEMAVRAGYNITLSCDLDPGVKEVEWLMNTTHLNQPKTITMSRRYPNPRFRVLEHTKTQSPGLRIQSITEQDLGLYYCTGSKDKVEERGTIYKVHFQDSLPCPQSPTCPPPPEHGVSWTVLFTVCPIAVLLSAAVSSILVYCLLRKNVSKENELNQEPKNRTGSRKQDEDICYASLDLPSTRRKQKAKKKREESTDFCTYSEVRGAAK